MLRLFAVLLMSMVFAASVSAADLISMKLCPSKDYDASSRDCANGKSLPATGGVIDPAAVGTLQFLTAVKTTNDEEIYHVWISVGKTSGKVSVYDAATKTLREADASELDWLKARNIEGARSIIKMTAKPSPRFRLRSEKSFIPSMSGPWKVQVYAVTATTPLGEITFNVAVPDNGITN